MLAFTVLFTLALTFLEMLVWVAAEHPRSPSNGSRRTRHEIADDALHPTLGTFLRHPKRTIVMTARR